MNYLSINEWGALARENPTEWAASVRRAVTGCVQQTGTAVVSWDVSADGCELHRGPLAGVPYGLKELFDLEGWPSHNSSVHPDLMRARARGDSDVVQHLNGLGATCAAKTQMNEFAYGLSGENPHYGNCPHPHLKGCLTGGSSGGSAHLVAGGYVPLAFGTDTGGSIRLPAAWCGLYGLRCVPGYKMGGCFPLARSFDAVGWFTRTLEDMRTATAAWFGDPSARAAASLRGSCLMPEDLVDAATFARLSDAVGKLGLVADARSAELEAWLPSCNVAFNVLQSGEAYGIHRQWIGPYGDFYDPLVRARILRAEQWTPEEIQSARDFRAKVMAWFDTYFETYDYLVLPACPRPAVSVAETTPDLREKILRLTSPASLARRPVITVPFVLDGRQTVGLQFIFKELDGATALGLLDLCASI